MAIRGNSWWLWVLSISVSARRLWLSKDASLAACGRCYERGIVI